MSAATLTLPGPCGGVVDVPAGVAPDDPYAGIREDALRREYYADEGYLVLRGLIPEESCAAVRAGFDDEVRTHRGLLFRQTTGRPEKNELTAAGHLRNPILNVQDLPRRAMPAFRGAGLDVITHPALAAAIETILGEPGVVVQSMCFEANPVTPAHQDSYYLDSARLGGMVAAWIALEDIPAGAGRFFVFPRSHRSSIAQNTGGLDVAFHHDRYHRLVVDTMRDGAYECRAPALRRGDVLLWNALTVHGSLETVDATASRFSLTAHFIPATAGFLKFQKMPIPLRLERVNGVDVHSVRPLDVLRYRAELEIAGRLPRTYAFAKRCAIKLRTR